MLSPRGLFLAFLSFSAKTTANRLLGRPEPLKFETKAIRLAHDPDPKNRAVVSPVHLGTTFQFEDVGLEPIFDYSRSNNPTRSALERTLAGLEGGDHAIAFSSGMAAVDAVMSILVPGDEVVAARNLYGGSPRLFDKVYAPRGIAFHYLDVMDGETIGQSITARTRLVVVETPTNPQLQIFDIAAIARACKAHGVPLAVDNTFASPYLQRPLELGADVVVQSTTKYIAGHHDVVGGAVITSDAAWHEKVRFYQNTQGSVPSAFDCYLTTRGIKTLSLRMRHVCASAQAIAEFLKDHPKVDKVLYPGLPEHPGHDLAARQMSGFGGMVTFFIKGGEKEVKTFCRGLGIFHFAESLGGAESLICHPSTMSHAVLSEEERTAAGITYQMIRISAGLEHPDDLIADLEQALG